MSHSIIHPRDVLAAALKHPARLIAPVVVMALLAVVYALVRPATWEAAQALSVRDEAGDRLTRPGKFAHADEMKTSQETILELAKSRNVLTKALKEVGPEDAAKVTGSWPTSKDVETLQAAVKVTPPKGAEFGKTEVFYLKVQADNPARAVKLAEAISRQLQNRFGELRELKAKSTTDELTKTAGMAHANLDEATVALSKMEQRVGGDLAELRILNELPSGDSDLRRAATEMERELRGYQAAQTEGQEFLRLLSEAQTDPAKLLASPSVLLKSQPALGRLKDGLVDAQIRTGQALGNMSESHPLVKAAREAEQAIRRQMHDEIGVAIGGVQADLRVNAERTRQLEQQHASIVERLGLLAGMRAEYGNLVAAAKTRAENLKTVEHDLAEARASQAAARSSNLINLIDTPDTGTRPVGPGRTMIVLAGAAAGFVVSLAILFLSVKPQDVPMPESRSLPVSLPLEPVLAAGKALTIRQALERVSRIRA